MYMTHNCKTLAGFYHKRLYNKYKNESGLIQFCTICGRICESHKHYKLSPPTGDKPPVLPAGGPFENDCRISNGGGGIAEKAARFIAIRNKAIELNEQIDKIPKETALEQIIEAGWSAPLDPQMMSNAQRQLQKKKFNNSNKKLPNKVQSNDPINASTLPNIVRPAESRAFTPILHRYGENSITLNDVNGESYHNNTEEDQLIEFRHPYIVEGVRYFKHQGKLVSRSSLFTFINDKIDGFQEDEGAGLCIFQPDCQERLYPEEIQGLIPEDLYNKYRLNFNLKFRQQGGTRKNRKRHGGEEPLPFDIEITNGACAVPTRNKKSASKGGKYRIKTHKKRQGKRRQTRRK